MSNAKKQKINLRLWRKISSLISRDWKSGSRQGKQTDLLIVLLKNMAVYFIIDVSFNNNI